MSSLSGWGQRSAGAVPSAVRLAATGVGTQPINDRSTAWAGKPLMHALRDRDAAVASGPGNISSSPFQEAIKVNREPASRISQLHVAFPIVLRRKRSVIPKIPHKLAICLSLRSVSSTVS
jgi:hypothetical protein